MIVSHLVDLEPRIAVADEEAVAVDAQAMGVGHGIGLELDRRVRVPHVDDLQFVGSVPAGIAARPQGDIG
jgi:hypothetical protein